MFRALLDFCDGAELGRKIGKGKVEEDWEGRVNEKDGWGSEKTDWKQRA